MFSNLILGPIEGALGLVSIAIKLVALVALVDAALRPAQVFRAAVDQSKTSWLVILAIALVIAGLSLFGLIALVIAIVYLVDTRPKLKEIGRPRRRWRSGPSSRW